MPLKRATLSSLVDPALASSRERQECFLRHAYQFGEASAEDRGAQLPIVRLVAGRYRPLPAIVIQDERLEG